MRDHSVPTWDILSTNLSQTAEHVATKVTESAWDNLELCQKSINLASQSTDLPLEWYISDVDPWQSESDLPERRYMVQRLVSMTRGKLAASTATDISPSLAKRIELSLYSRAASLMEYRDLNTLRRRLQSLVCMSVHEAFASKQLKRCHSNFIRKRKGTDILSRTNMKRIRETMTIAPSHRSYLLAQSIDILQVIFSYLPGQEAIQCTTLNKYAAVVIPSCVTTLSLDVCQLQIGFQVHSSSLLSQFTHLTTLHIHNRNKKCSQLNENRIDSSTNPMTSHDEIGEQVVLQLAESITNGACVHLRKLQLISVFNNTYRYNALHALSRALACGFCPNLRELLLGGNSISDLGTVDIAWVLGSGALSQLERLDIRRNFIGEAGLKRIMFALSKKKCMKLCELYMGGNIINDHCVAPMIKVLSDASCPEMRFLGLEDNFLSRSAVQSIIEAAVVGGMMPKLHQVHEAS